MPEIIDKAKQFAENKLNQKSQPGNKVEGTADNDVNQKLDNVANQAGVPGQDDQLLNKVADTKVNSDIPFGNN